MNKIILVNLIILLMFCCVFASETSLPPLKGADMWFIPPIPEEKANDGYWKVLLYKADRKGFNERYRYSPHVSNREYLNCTYYKYVNCEDIRFSRCWQCKDYDYNFRF